MTHVEAKKMTLEDGIKIGFGVTLSALVGALTGWFKSVNGKASQDQLTAAIKAIKEEQERALAQLKADSERQMALFRQETERQLAELQRRNSNWEMRASQFATREMVVDLKSDFLRLEGRFSEGFKTINDTLLRLMEKKD